MNWRRDTLPTIVRAMAGRPRHEALRGHISELLREGFGAAYSEIEHELYLLDNTGRIDTMWGATVIKLKSDLRRELPDVLARIPAYLTHAASRARSPRPVTGIATDGATFIGYQLVDGALAELRRTTADPDRPGTPRSPSACSIPPAAPAPSCSTPPPIEQAALFRNDFPRHLYPANLVSSP